MKFGIISKDVIHKFMVKSLTCVGASETHSSKLADNLSMADHRGHYSHGLNRLDMYVRDVKAGSTNVQAEPTVARNKAASALVDGKNLLGPVVGHYSMKLAIEKAKKYGVGMVSANNSNHYGIAGFYSMLAVSKGMIGLSFCNTSPLVIPTRAKHRSLGTNPLSFAAPADANNSTEEAFCLDMATSCVAFGKVELHNLKEASIPSAWGTDAEGLSTSDPSKVIKDGGLHPLGGPELTSGYKGYGLGFMVEALCGILSGANYGPHIRKWQTSSEPPNLGQCFMAIDPEAFAPDFRERMKDLMDHCRKLPPADPNKAVLVPGDPERCHVEYCTKLGGIPYHVSQLKMAEKLAESLNIDPPKYKWKK
ncbi:hypothetical protein SNEBB_008174 [Seison nebaliae]|nr:hypothetical protein SNEBB_008174 [Seison nebaliae]